MIQVSYTKFKKDISRYFDDIEGGGTIEIVRRGKPSAVLSKAKSQAEKKAYWKNVRPFFNLGSDIATRMLLEERARR